MNYFRAHNIDPHQLRDRFIQALKDTGMSDFRASQSSGLNYTSIKTFISKPEIVRYGTAATIHNWLENLESMIKNER